MKKILLVLIALFSGYVSVHCSGNNTPPNILLLPTYISIDAANNRLFVVDSQNNGFSLIDLSTNTIVTDNPLLNNESQIQINQLPQDIAAFNLGNGVSRIFIIGNGPITNNVISVLEYDSLNGLHISPLPPITVGTNPLANLSGLTFDVTSGFLYVSDSTGAQVRVYNALTGAEAAGSPIAVNLNPSKMGLNATAQRLFVSSLGGNQISVINTSNLAGGAVSIDVGLPTSSVASASNTVGTVLFTVSPTQNEVQVFNYNVAGNTVTALNGSPILPPPATNVSANNVLTGAATQVAAAPLTNGQIAGIITQSSGDLGVIDVAPDLSGFAFQGFVPVLSGLGATGIDLLKDGSGNGQLAYFAAPGGSAVNIVDIVNNLFVGTLF